MGSAEPGLLKLKFRNPKTDHKLLTIPNKYFKYLQQRTYFYSGFEMWTSIVIPNHSHQTVPQTSLMCEGERKEEHDACDGER